MSCKPQIFELFGYPVDSWSSEAMLNMRRCHCPFMDAECDGGGNRFSSGITLRPRHPLSRYFPGKRMVQAGVCSLQLHKGEQPWIVCPRRLLNYRNGDERSYQGDVKTMLYEKSGLVKGGRYLAWSEVKMKCGGSSEEEGLFDYTFDYIITGKGRKPVDEICDMLGMSERKALHTLAKSGFTTCRKSGKTFCDDFPMMPLVIVEVMTSSTCGGNKTKRTQISQLFEDTVLMLNGVETTPGGPSINYRQVWARMVSQLLVKSQIGNAWGGVTFWVLQDLLAEYISKTTALNFSDFLGKHRGEVNVIAGGYGDELMPSNRRGDLIGLRDVKFYSGKVAAASTGEKAFSDIIKLKCVPDRKELLKRLVQKPPCASFVF